MPSEWVCIVSQACIIMSVLLCSLSTNKLTSDDQTTGAHPQNTARQAMNVQRRSSEGV